MSWEQTDGSLCCTVDHPLWCQGCEENWHDCSCDEGPAYVYGHADGETLDESIARLFDAPPTNASVAETSEP